MLNESCEVRVKNHPGATAEDICNHLKPEIQKKPGVVIIHTGENDLTINSKILGVWQILRSKLRNCKLAISNVITRKGKNKTDQKGDIQYQTFQISQKEQNRYHW